MIERHIKDADKVDLSSRFGDRIGVGQRQAYDMITQLQEVMVDMLAEGHSVSLPSIVTLRVASDGRRLGVTASVSKIVAAKVRDKLLGDVDLLSEVS